MLIYADRIGWLIGLEATLLLARKMVWVRDIKQMVLVSFSASPHKNKNYRAEFSQGNASFLEAPVRR